MDDLDDFEVPKPPPTKKSKPEVTSSELLVSSKWSGSALLENLDKNSIPYSIQKAKHFFADFKLPGGCQILILSEADYIGGNKIYRLALAKFYKNFKASSVVVICVRSEASAEDFIQVQNFCVIELQFSLIPISSLDKIPQLLSQLIATEPCKKKVNPFKFGLPKTSLISSTEKDLLKILHTVPALGDAKARLLLEKLPTLQEIATAEQVKLAKIIGKGPANAVFDFFHHE